VVRGVDVARGVQAETSEYAKMHFLQILHTKAFASEIIGLKSSIINILFVPQ